MKNQLLNVCVLLLLALNFVACTGEDVKSTLGGQEEEPLVNYSPYGQWNMRTNFESMAHPEFDEDYYQYFISNTGQVLSSVTILHDPGKVTKIVTCYKANGEPVGEATISASYDVNSRYPEEVEIKADHQNKFTYRDGGLEHECRSFIRAGEYWYDILDNGQLELDLDAYNYENGRRTRFNRADKTIIFNRM
jgi:hypothetical protein